MEGSVKAGFMAAFAVSGSVIILAHQVHKRLLSHFMKEFEYELRGCEKHHTKKKVRCYNQKCDLMRFAEKVLERSSDNMECRKRHWMKNKERALKAAEAVDTSKLHGCRQNLEGSMPINRLILYKGIMEHRRLRGP